MAWKIPVPFHWRKKWLMMGCWHAPRDPAKADWSEPAVFMRDGLRGLMSQMGFQDMRWEMGRLSTWSLFLNY